MSDDIKTWRDCDPCTEDCSDVRANCDPCSDELNQYESDIYTNIIYFLEELTCIPWIRDMQDAGEPNDNINNVNLNKQHGRVYIQSINPGVATLEEDICVGEIERCKRVSVDNEVTVSLNIYNYSDCGISKSPADILRQLYSTHYVVNSVKQNLCAFGIQVQNWGNILNIPTEQEATMKNRAQQTIVLNMTSYTSIAETLIKEINVSLNCCNNITDN